MRRAASTKPAWVSENDRLIGIQLGADFTAEHEFGIKGLKGSLGLMSIDEAKSGKVFGAVRYMIQNANPDHFLFVETKTTHEAILIYNPETFGCSWKPNAREERAKMPMAQLARHYEIDIHKPWREDQEPETLACAWDEKSFGIHVKGCKRQHAWLKELYQAFLDRDAVVFLGKPPMEAFSNSSLTLMIATRIPQEGLDIMEQTDREQWELERDAEATGIEDRLQDAGLRWFALKPRRGLLENRVSHGTTPATKYNLMFWLNPMEQDRNNSGWFTVEELEAWIRGEGPVPKQRANA